MNQKRSKQLKGAARLLAGVDSRATTPFYKALKKEYMKDKYSVLAMLDLLNEKRRIDETVSETG